MRLASARSKTPPWFPRRATRRPQTRKPPVPHAGSQIVKSGLPRGSGFMHADDGLDEHARREVLAGAFLAFAGGLFEQSLEGRGLHVHVQRRPLRLVDHGDDALEVDRIVEARRGLRRRCRRAARRLRGACAGCRRSDRSASVPDLSLQRSPSRSPSATSTPRSSAILRKSR